MRFRIRIFWGNFRKGTKVSKRLRDDFCRVQSFSFCVSYLCRFFVVFFPVSWLCDRLTQFFGWFKWTFCPFDCLSFSWVLARRYFIGGLNRIIFTRDWLRLEKIWVGVCWGESSERRHLYSVVFNDNVWGLFDRCGLELSLFWRMIDIWGSWFRLDHAVHKFKNSNLLISIILISNSYVHNHLSTYPFINLIIYQLNH